MEEKYMLDDKNLENQEVSKEEITPVDMNINIHEINQNVDNTNFSSDVEKKRESFYKNYKKASKFSTYSTLGVVVLVIVGFILITMNGNDAAKISGYVILGIAAVYLVVYYVLNRNRMPRMTKEYMAYINSAFNGYLYSDKKFERVSVDPSEKLDMGEITSDGVYSNVYTCGSRNVVHGKFKNHDFLVADASVDGKDGKKQIEYFVGKYISCDNGLKFDGRVVFNYHINGDKKVDLPNGVEDLAKVEENDSFTIWATPGLDYKNVLTDEIIKFVSSHFVVSEEKHLLNVNIVVWGGHTGVYLSYDNSLMTFPFDKPFDSSGIDAFKQDQNAVFDLFDMMMKEKVVKTNKVIEETKPESKDEEK